MAKTADKVAQAGAVQALSDFGYGGSVGRVYRGEVFVMSGAPNDEILRRLRYVKDVQEGTHLFECGECGKLFVSEGTRELHGVAAHELQCPCGYSPTPSDPKTMKELLERHRLRCDVWRDERDAHLARRAKEVMEIKKAEPVVVG